MLDLAAGWFMQTEFEAFDRLRILIATEEGKLLASIPSTHRRVVLLELTRAIDSLRGLASQTDDPKVHSLWNLFYSHGWPRALRLLLGSEVAAQGDPYFLSTVDSHQLALSILHTCADLSMTENAIALCDYGLFTLKEWTDDRFVFEIAAQRVGLEAEERADQEWLRWRRARDGEKFHALLSEHGVAVEKALERNVVRVEDFMAYEAEPILDDYYEAQGALYSATCFGQDLFPDSTQFGGRPFRLFRDAVRTLIGWALRHEAFAGVLLRRHNDLCVRNVFTQCASIDSLAGDLARKLGVSPEDARLALEMVTATPQNKSILESSGPSPMFVTIGEGRVIKSFAGACTQPYYFMLRALKLRFLDEWNAATDAREEVFRDEIYELLSAYELEFVRKPIVLRTPKGQTDIDAAILDSSAGVLGLFQLKWQEPYGHSMRERASRKQNFEKANQWVDRLTSWLDVRNPMDATRALGFAEVLCDRVKCVRLIVLSREHSHFSGPNELDPRAAWGNWFQTLRLVATQRPREDPIGFLWGALRTRTEDGPAPRKSVGSEHRFKQWSVRVGT